MFIEILEQKINYEILGQGNDILLLHGWGASIESYRPVINTLSKNFRVIALDFPGFGNSDPLKKAWCLSDFSEMVKQFLQKLNIEKPIIIGHSHGGRVIIQHSK